MDREDQLIGEIISARAVAQMACFLMVQNNVIPREEVEDHLSAAVALWAMKSKSEDPKPALHAGIAAVRLNEFLTEFRDLMGGAVQ